MKIGIDLGGTKTEGILIENSGYELKRQRIKTEKNYDGTINGILSIVKSFENLHGNLFKQINFDYNFHFSIIDIGERCFITVNNFN